MALHMRSTGLSERYDHAGKLGQLKLRGPQLALADVQFRVREPVHSRGVFPRRQRQRLLVWPALVAKHRLLGVPRAIVPIPA